MMEETSDPELAKALDFVVKRMGGTSGDRLAHPIPAVYPPGNYLNGNGDEGAELHLRDYWRAIRKHLLLIASLTLLITVLAAIFVARKPDIFEATSRVQVNLDSSAASLNSSKNTLVISGDNNDPAYFNTQIQILTSPALLRRVVKTLDLEHNTSFLNPGTGRSTSTWHSLLRLVGLGGEKTNTVRQPADVLSLSKSMAPSTSREDLIEAAHLEPFVDGLKLVVKVERVVDSQSQSDTKETRLIDIRVKHSDAQLAAKVANAVADTFMLSNLEKKTETNTTTGEFFQKRIAELQGQIRTDEERLINYAKSNQILSLDASQNTVVERLAGLNRGLLEAENDRKKAEAEYRSALAPGAAAALIESEVRRTQEKLEDLRQKRAELLVDNTEEWPAVKEIGQQIAALELSLKDARGNASSTLLKNLETRYRQALAREESLRTAFAQQRGETLTQNEAAINYRIIQQEVETNKKLLEGLLQGARENDVVLAGTPNNIFVLDYALMPKIAIGPKRFQTIALAFLLSVIFSIGLSLFLEYLDNTVRSTDDVERLLHLPAMAVIPSMSLGKGRKLLGRSKSLQHNGDESSELLIANKDQTLGEAYRHLRTAVLLSTAGRAPKTILVSSSLPGEGKTTTAVNIAVSLAQTGAKILIIDADMRRPRLHSIFGMSNKVGLSTALASELSEAEMLSLIAQYDSGDIYLLPSGPLPPNPAELIGSDQMKRLLTAMENTFTHIVIDSPPIASFTDAVLLSPRVDGMLFVVHGGKSSRHIVRRARQIIQDVGGKILGVVLNNIDVRTDDYYYYNHYYGKYYKSAEEGQQTVVTAK